MNEAKTSILLVDDDRDLLKLLTLRLTAAGYAVQTAESGAQALAQLAVARPRWTMGGKMRRWRPCWHTIRICRRCLRRN